MNLINSLRFELCSRKRNLFAYLTRDHDTVLLKSPIYAAISHVLTLPSDIDFFGTELFSGQEAKYLLGEKRAKCLSID